MQSQTTFHFVSGMPRSGSTLLCNILNQNPRFLATPTSGLCPLLLRVNFMWTEIPELNSSSTPKEKFGLMAGMFHGFHGSERPVIFNKSRGWVSAIELIKNVLGIEPKILVTVRDIPSILSSCEKLFRKELQSPQSVARWGQNMETIEGRLQFWTAADQMVGGQFNRIRDCVTRGNRRNLHFIDFDDLCENQRATMEKVYQFLGEEPFEHDFNNVEQTTHEKDQEHGFVDLHTIRSKVEPVKKDYKKILGDSVKPYIGYSYDFIS
jgi:sulfotransferase